jgi:MerR family transcriptional regulator, copper efflux regulator
MSANGASASLRIGEVAARTGVTVEALRYYEREGLLPAPARTASGIRRFRPEVVTRVQFVKQAQAAGLTLRDIRQLTGLERGRSRTVCERMRKVLAQRMGDIDSRVQELQTFRTMLEGYIRACDSALAAGAEPKCPSLDALDPHSQSQRKGVTQCE